MESKVFSDWLSSYTKTTRLDLKIYKMAEYFPDSPRTHTHTHTHTHTQTHTPNTCRVGS